MCAASDAPKDSREAKTDNGVSTLPPDQIQQQENYCRHAACSPLNPLEHGTENDPLPAPEKKERRTALLTVPEGDRGILPVDLDEDSLPADVLSRDE